MMVVANSCLLCLPWSVEEEQHNARAVHGLTATSAVITLLFVFEVRTFDHQVVQKVSCLG